MSSRKRVAILGSSFAGLTAALELRKRVSDRHEIVVLDPRPDFTFIPSLIWLPFGIRDAKDVTFPLAPVYASKGIRFVNEAAAGIDLDAHLVRTASGEELNYDKLFIGTGPRLAFEKVPGLGPQDGYTQSVCNLDHALLARAAWERFLENPGPAGNAGADDRASRAVRPRSCGSR
jgi:sulfide:quinone oxidoreductase